MALAVMAGLAWMGASLAGMRDEVRSLKDLRAEVETLKGAGEGTLADAVSKLEAELRAEINELENTVSGGWHQHDPGSLAALAILANKSETEWSTLFAVVEGLDKERRDLKVALEGFEKERQELLDSLEGLKKEHQEVFGTD
ncbi:MAG: hypothetical protein GWO24_35355, partial [Akkermansiaceae bacterium]|nr:hypothetical protein [Akkermansiaceae bacterium]